MFPRASHAPKCANRTHSSPSFELILENSTPRFVAYLVSLESFVLKAKLLETLLLQQQVTNAERLLQESQPSANAKDPHRERLETHVALLRREVQEKDRLIEKSLRSIHELTKNLETLLKNQIETENQRYE